MDHAYKGFCGVGWTRDEYLAVFNPTSPDMGLIVFGTVGRRKE
jgi:hypothetical protein